MTDRHLAITVSLPESMVARIDKEAGRQGWTRSLYVREALKERLVKDAVSRQQGLPQTA